MTPRDLQVSVAHERGQYDRSFFDHVTEGSLPSARVIAPLVQGLIDAKSVVDVGCGEGAWLKAFAENGATRLQGIDGPWVDRSRLLIDPADFQAVDLGRRELKIEGQYDLAICLEVAEHLSPSRAPGLVGALSECAPAVLFSAALPGQGGTHHVNEQWPAYWQALFKRRGFDRLDPVRRVIWLDYRVAWWYRQNVFLFIDSESLSRSPKLQGEVALTEQQDLELISRQILDTLTTVRGLLAALPPAVGRSVRRLLSPSR